MNLSSVPELIRAFVSAFDVLHVEKCIGQSCLFSYYTYTKLNTNLIVGLEGVLEQLLSN